MKVIVVGASNMDIIARSSETIIGGDSNIGKVEKAPGGVGRNIARAMKALGMDVSILTAVANDESGDVLISGLKSDGIAVIPGPEVGDNAHTGIYCCIIDKDGSLVCAVNDMSINESLDSKLINDRKEALEDADFLVFEANLPIQTIEALTGLDVNLIADCVSTTKAPRLGSVLESLYMLKANFAEACILAGVQGALPDADGLDEVMNALVSKGLKRAIISLGRDGAFCYEVTGTGTRGFEAGALPEDNVISSNGCGDVLLAGFLRGMSEGMTSQEALVFGQAASAINSGSLEAVSPELNYENVKRKADEYYEQLH